MSKCEGIIQYLGLLKCYSMGNVADSGFDVRAWGINAMLQCVAHLSFLTGSFEAYMVKSLEISWCSQGLAGINCIESLSFMGVSF